MNGYYFHRDNIATLIVKKMKLENNGKKSVELECWINWNIVEDWTVEVSVAHIIFF